MADDRDRPGRADGWDRGHWMQTFTGRAFYPMDPQPRDIDIVDIAHSLAYQCRYNGHTRRFYSVAEHCVLMSRVVPERDALWALLHDATEAYVGDMVRPLKLHMPAYRQAEDKVMAAIAVKFGLPSSRKPDSVRDADDRILQNEREALLGEPELPWSTKRTALNLHIEMWSPEGAERQYLRRFVELHRDHGFSPRVEAALLDGRPARVANAMRADGHW